LKKKMAAARLKCKTENLQHKQKGALKSQEGIKEHILQLAGISLEEGMPHSLLSSLPKCVMGRQGGV
jgi:hypothetical protein